MSRVAEALAGLARPLEPIAKHEFASPESRLISLGHALHLAERCWES